MGISQSETVLVSIGRRRVSATLLRAPERHRWEGDAVSIFRKIRQFRELSRLRRAAGRSPSPGTIGALAERYIALGRMEDAYRTAAAGMRSFPTSERLIAVRTFAKKQGLQTEIQALRREVAERPTPSAYTRLAGIYRGLGNFDEALSICAECVERFPLNENPYLIIGEVRLTRFLKDLIAVDGIEAEKQLKRVVKLNDQNLKAHLLLTQLYHSVGATEDLLVHLGKSIQLSPDAEELTRYRREIESRPVEAPPPQTDADDDEWFDPTEASFTERVRAVESAAAFRFRPEDCPAWRLLPGSIGVTSARLDVESLKENLREVGDRPGVENAVILDRDGEPLADCSDTESLTRKQFSELVGDILRTSEDTSRRMDIGTFHWCTVEGAFGGISIARVKNISLGVKFGSELKADRAHLLLQEFAARNYRSEPEVSHA